VPLHVFRGHVRGEDIPVVGHGNPFGQDLVSKISVPCVRSGKEMTVRTELNCSLFSEQQV
jgi:hypothetical protein